MKPKTGILLALAAAFALGCGTGWRLRDGAAVRAALEAERRQAAQLAIARSRIAEAEKAGERIGSASAERQVEIRYRTHEIIREVPTYVTVEADRQCSVPLGFVRLHDQAASGAAGEPAQSAAAPHDAPSGLALSSVAATLAENYGACRADQDRLRGLQAWLRAQSGERQP